MIGRRNIQRVRSRRVQNGPTAGSRSVLLITVAAAGTIALSASAGSASGIDHMAQYCRGNMMGDHTSRASTEECFPLRPIPDDDNTYDALADSQTITEDLGQVCLEFMQGPPSSTGMLEVTFKTSNGWVMTDAHFWLGNSIDNAPQMIMHLHDDTSRSNTDSVETTDGDHPSTTPSTARNNQDGSEDEHVVTTTYPMPDATHFPFYTTMEDAEDPLLRTTTAWNEVVEANPDTICVHW